MTSVTVIFKSSSGDGVYHADCWGSPVTQIVCTCRGYESIKCCKHINAILEGDPLLTDPAPLDGYDAALKAMVDSPARVAYKALLAEIDDILDRINGLKSQEKTLRKIFYRRLSEGIEE